VDGADRLEDGSSAGTANSDQVSGKGTEYSAVPTVIVRVLASGRRHRS
jgi:hypothetical protein